MIELGSGKIIDLSTNRSKYHALRQHGAGPVYTHRQLYSLVDIIYRRTEEAGNIRTGWTEYDYDYSGYTLATVRGAKDWTEEDKTAIEKWIQEADQIRVIETARRRLIDNQNQLSVKDYSAPKLLYSVLEQRLKKLPLQRATVEQWLATIIKQKQNGLREEEIQWSGLMLYLRQHATSTIINKADIIKNISYENIRIELSTEQVWGANGGLSFCEVALRMPHQAVYRAALKLDEECLCILRYVDSVCNYRVGVVKTLNNNHRMALNKYWFALDSYGRAIPNPVKLQSKVSKDTLFFENSVDAKFAADKHARENMNVRSGAKTHTHFDHLSLYGGYDYREWLVSLPDLQRTFFGAHFYDHNVLAHIRTTTRTDLSGKKILFIEEVQSDWHQSAKRYGYDTRYWGQIADAPFKQDWPVLAAKLMLIHASQNGFDGIAWSPGNVQEMRYHCQLQSIKHYYDKKIPDALTKLVKDLNCQVTDTKIKTRDPWLNVEKKHDKWRVADGLGKFKTKAKYNNRDEAMMVIARHCRVIGLDVSVLLISDELRRQVSENGLPLFGLTKA
jgi:hypothetical protein